MKSPRFSDPNLRQSQYRQSKLSLALIAATVIASSQLLAMLSASANPVPTPTAPPLVTTRSILNGSFEQPVIRSWVGAPTNSSVTGGAVTNLAGGNILEAYNSRPGLPIIWQSTDRGNSNTRGNYNYKDAIEVWRGVNVGNGGQSATSGAGVQHAELNGSDDASLFQDVCILPNETVTWSLLHAVRYSGTNIMQVSITDPSNWGTGKIPPATKLYNSGDLSTTDTQGWVSKTGTWQSTNTTIKKLRFAFQAIKGTSGNNSVGNFIDNVSLDLSPLIDFLPTGQNVNLAKTTEGNTPNYYYLSLRINGDLNGSSSVKISLNGLNANRQFRLGDILKGGTAATGFSTTKSGNEITLNIPAGVYDPNVVGDYIHIPIDFSDTVKMRNDNLTFTLSNPTGGGVGSALGIGSTNCASSARTTVNTLLKDDDYIRRL